ncbi:YbdK family carboxylate-amine ligase [Rathayibacter sp. SD072]|uniref:carboxylate-amine ligase n=1 Tax=Rathayibacter sp. SD072 TaxID=2781731 RepID=UPI001A96CD47|nr:YbdK family carboxylate-amine ligase [Rathayibacter sp. SD072]MBO0984599.1 YbdK family carboxylate-amine ligase [Rathayibacter sp. SD072]
MLGFGIEEEFVLLDAAGLRPLDLGNAVYSEFFGDPNFGGCVGREFLACQLEFTSPVLRSLAQAHECLSSFRSRLAATAAEFDALAAGVGVPFSSGGAPALSPEPRYREVGERMGALLEGHRIQALHVHVEVPNRDAGAAALNRLRVWLPTLLALSVNSPFQGEADSGFGSWRSVALRRWSTAGCPPLFTGADDYDRRERALIGLGSSVDREAIAWQARLSSRYPTLEIRVADAQLDAADSVLLAGICRALVRSGLERAEAGEPCSPLAPELLDAGLWHAGRFGLDGTLLSPGEGRALPAAEVVAELREWIDRGLRANGDTEAVDDGLERLARIGTGAARQRRAFAEGGTRGLSELLGTPGAPAPRSLQRELSRRGEW